MALKISNHWSFDLRDYWYLSQNYDLPQGTESNSRKGTNNLSNHMVSRINFFSTFAKKNYPNVIGQESH